MLKLTFFFGHIVESQQVSLVFFEGSKWNPPIVFAENVSKA